jgi:hypothetical protein
LVFSPSGFRDEIALTIRAGCGLLKCSKTAALLDYLGNISDDDDLHGLPSLVDDWRP